MCKGLLTNMPDFLPELFFRYKNFFSSRDENIENEWDQFLSEEKKNQDARERDQDHGVDSNLFTFKACFGTQSGF
jgi:hypothetical protein